MRWIVALLVLVGLAWFASDNLIKRAHVSMMSRPVPVTVISS